MNELLFNCILKCRIFITESLQTIKIIVVTVIVTLGVVAVVIFFIWIFKRIGNLFTAAK